MLFEFPERVSFEDDAILGLHPLWWDCCSICIWGCLGLSKGQREYTFIYGGNIYDRSSAMGTMLIQVIIVLKVL